MSGVSVFTSTVSPRITLLDEQTGVTYVGRASPGSSTSSPVWQVRRLLTTGTVLAVEYAGGNQNFDSVWDDRASLSYS